MSFEAFDGEDDGDVHDDDDYAPRSWDKSQDDSIVTRRKLPTKTETGSVIKKPIERVKRKQDQQENDEEAEAIKPELGQEEEEEEDVKKRNQAEEEEVVDEETALFNIAQLSNAILANEPNAVRAVGVKTTATGVAVPPEPTAMDRLLSMCRQQAVWPVRKASILSLLAVFKDVLPDEKVRELTEVELKAKTTKETRMMRSYEKVLMNAYRLFLAILFEAVKKAPWEAQQRNQSTKKKKEDATNKAKMGRLAVYSLCSLLEARPDFNFYEEILKTVVPRTSSPDAKVSRICSESLQRAIEDDASFQCSLHVVRMLGRTYEKRKTVSSKAVEAFAQLKLNVDLKDEKRMDVITKAKKEKLKKRRRLGVDLARVLEETDVVQTRNHEVFQRQTELVRELFTLYLRILTDASEDPSTKLRRPLTFQALRGCSRVVPLVNIEFVHGLVKILTCLFPVEEELNVEIALQTCETGLTAMAILARPELRTKTTASEEVFFTKLLLRCVTQLSANENALVHITSVMRCVSMLFLKRREQDVRVVSDFCVRLISASTRVPAHFALGLLCIQRNLLEKYPGAKDLVLGVGRTAEEEPCGPLVPVAFSSDSVGSQARPAWELTVLGQSHYHVAVKKFACEARLGKPNFNEKPVELMSLHHPLDGDVFYPGIPLGRTKAQKKRPAAQMEGEGQKRKNNKQQKKGGK